MPIDIINTETNEIHILQDITISDILKALKWYKNEKERKKQYKKTYIPTGNRRGRPPKCPAPQKNDLDKSSDVVPI
jgi:hypothetical protein